MKELWDGIIEYKTERIDEYTMKELWDGIIEYKTERIDEYGMEELWDVKYNSGRDGFLKIQELA